MTSCCINTVETTSSTSLRFVTMSSTSLRFVYINDDDVITELLSCCYLSFKPEIEITKVLNV